MITACRAWAGTLAVRREDLSQADREALDAHVAICSACCTVLNDYRFLDESLKALPFLTVMPLPRLALVPDEPEVDVYEDKEPYLLERVPKGNRAGSIPVRVRRMVPAGFLCS